MSQQLALFEPSIQYYCHSCRKTLKHSVRVIAQISDLGCLLDFCPPCLAHQNYVYKVQNYFIAKKVGTIFKQMSNVSASQLLESISFVQKEGIEQMFLKSIKPQDRQLQVYEQLNKQVLSEESASLRVELGQYEIPVDRGEKEKQNPPNRKHLKTLGYSWERGEFGFQPEIVFGYLMGCLEEEEQPTEDQIQLRNIIYNYYSQEAQIVEQVKDYLVQSPFLLARKAIYDIQQVPIQLTELRNIQSEIKELVASICNMDIDDEPQDSNHSSLNKHGERVKHRHKKNKKQRQRSESSVQQNKDQRERTRQKKEKKKNKKQTQEQPPVIDEAKSDNEVGEAKRKRGRPKGSKSKVKVQRRRGRSRVFQLKMDIQNKISHKRHKTDTQELQQQSESYQNRKRRKLNEEIDSQAQQSQSEENQSRQEDSSDDQ